MEPQDPLPQNAQPAPGGMSSQDANLPVAVDMEVIEHPENPQSIWGHRLRQNIRSRLLNRGVDLRLIEDTENLPPQPNGQAPSQNEHAPEYGDADVAGVAEGTVSWARDVSIWPRMLLQTIGSHKPGICKLCARTMTNITKHHVHPKVGPNSQRLPPPDMKDSSYEYLNTTVDLCRPCHSMIHHIIPNKVMSDSYHSIPLLESHPRVKAWVDWVRRQRIPTPQPFTQSIPLLGGRSGKRNKGGKTKIMAERVQKKQERAKRNVENTKVALAKLWSDSGNAIPRSLDNLPALKQKISDLAGGESIRIKILRKLMTSNAEYHPWYSWLFHGNDDTALADRRRRRRKRATARKDLETTDGTIIQIKAALDKIWTDNGNDYPKFQTDSPSRAEVLLNAVRTSVQDVEDAHIPATFAVAELQKAMRLEIEYRTWFDWTWPDADWAEGGLTDVHSHADDKHERSGGDRPQLGEAKSIYGTGTGSRADPIVFDLTDSETEGNTHRGDDNVTMSPSGRVVIDLTLDEDHGMDVDPRHSPDGRGNVPPVFFFDLGNRLQPRPEDIRMRSSYA